MNVFWKYKIYYESTVPPGTVFDDDESARNSECINITGYTLIQFINH